MYLRKSRRDVELEALGQGETLARHEKQLSALAERLGVNVVRVYREIVSGDTIAQRPQMQRLLADINAGTWDGVLCMDVDRLARGDSVDQGLIMQSLLYAGALVITPDKIYDPHDESDADFFEIKLFFARREYAAIKKRMQRGRLQSALDGCYQSPDLYGYHRYKLPGRRGYSLKIVPDEAAVVRSIFAWYAYGMDGQDVGANAIARRLNEMGLTTRSGHVWTPSTVKFMLKNPTYAGKIRWNTKTQQTRLVDGQRVKVRRASDNPVYVDGLHEAIIDAELWQRVAQIMAGHEKRPKNAMRRLANPFAGLIYCAECGRAMQVKGSGNKRGDFIYCPAQDCPTCSAYVFVVEDMVRDFLAQWVADYEADVDAPPPPDPDADARAVAIAQRRAELATLDKQSDNLYDLLEQGIYTVDVYKQRRAELDAKLSDARAALDALEAAAKPAPTIAQIVPQVRTVLAAYDNAPDPAARNALLRTVVSRIDYRKTQRLYRNNDLGDYITLTVYPKYPENTANFEDKNF